MSKAAVFYVVLSTLLAVSGCATQGSVKSDLAVEKEMAFNDWQSQRAQGSTQPADKVTSQPVIEGDLTLEEAIELALQHNRALQRARQGEVGAEGRIKEAYSEAYPKVSANGSLTFFDDQPVVGGIKDNYSAGLVLSQPLYRGGATGAGIRAAETFRAQAEENLRYEMQMTIFQTVKAFHFLRLAVRQCEVSERDVALAEAHLEDVKIRRKYGVASDFNVLRAQVELSGAKADLLGFQQELDAAENSLLMTMGVSQESRIVPVEQYEFKNYMIDEGRAVREAFFKRPDVTAAELAVKLQREAVVKARSDYRPSVDFFVDYTLSNPEPDNYASDEWGDLWSTGISVNLDLFDGSKRDGKLIQAQASLRQRETELLGIRELVVFEIRNAILSLGNAAESVRVQELVTQQADEGLRLAEVGYREGIIDQVSLLEARTSLIKAQLVYHRSLYQHALAILSLQRAMGVLDPGEFDAFVSDGGLEISRSAQDAVR